MKNCGKKKSKIWGKGSPIKIGTYRWITKNVAGIWSVCGGGVGIRILVDGDPRVTDTKRVIT